MMTVIRKAKPGDTSQLEILFQLTRQQAFTSRPALEFTLGDYQKSTNDDEVWVIEKNDVIVGFVSTYPADNFIHNLFVHPTYQKQGYGSQLLQIAEATLAKPMTLKIALYNLKVCSFYKKHGWQQLSVNEDAEESYVLYGKN